jgi:hypothetical protein
MYVHQLGIPLELLLYLPSEGRWHGYLGGGIILDRVLLATAEVNPRQQQEVLARGRVNVHRTGAAWRPLFILGIRRAVPESRAYSFAEIRWQPDWTHQVLHYPGLPAYPSQSDISFQMVSLNLGFSL